MLAAELDQEDLQLLTADYNSGLTLEDLSETTHISPEDLRDAILSYKREHEIPLNTHTQVSSEDEARGVKPKVLSCIERAKTYRRAVLDGVEEVPLNILRAVRLWGNFENPQEGYYWDERAVEKACNFVEEYCRHTKGKWKGQPLILQPWQCFVMAVAFGWMRVGSDVRQFQTIYVEVPRKNGKALCLDTPILTANRGWSTQGELVVGDYVFTPSGEPTRVEHVHPVEEGLDCYRLDFVGAESIVASGTHEWYTETRSGGQHAHNRNKVRETAEIAKTLRFEGRKENNHFIPVAGALEYGIESEFVIPPYVLGAWLGDGHTQQGVITCGKGDEHTIDRVSRELGRDWDWNGGNQDLNYRWYGFKGKLRQIGVLGDKRIPREYLEGSVEQRFDLLQGIVDTDGHIFTQRSGPARVEIVTIKRELAEDYLELVRGLGFKAPGIRSQMGSYEGQPRLHYRVEFNSRGDNRVCSMPRKVRDIEDAGVSNTRSKRTTHYAIKDVGQVESVPVRCITVEAEDGLYLAGRSLVCTHNSTWLAAVALYLTLADDEPGANVFCVASHLEQAKEVMTTAWTMVSASDAIKDDKDCRTMGSPTSGPQVVTNDRHTGTLEALAADRGGSLDGKNPSGVVVDELHAHPTPDTWNAIEQAIDAREQPMVWCITTAGTDIAGVCYREHEYVEKILEGVNTDDDSYCGFVWGASEEEAEEWDSEDLWRRVNPNWGVSVLADNYRKRASRARNSPSVLQTFKNKRLNVWGGTVDGWANMAYWLERKNLDPETEKPYVIGRGARVYVGLDLSGYEDLAAVSIIYELPFEAGIYHTGRYYIPQTTFDNSDNVLYKKWEDSGDLIVTPGSITDFGRIRQDVLDLRDEHGYEIVQVTFDGYQAMQMATELEDEGLEVVQFTQSRASYDPVMRYFERVLADERGGVWHDGNPAMTWMLSNVQSSERKGKLMTEKDKKNKSKKIDGAVAMLMNLTPLAIKEAEFDGPLLEVY